MPNQPADGQYNANTRMPRSLWDAAGDVAAAQGTDRGAEIRNFLRWWIGENVQLPVRAERRDKDT